MLLIFMEKFELFGEGVSVYGNYLTDYVMCQGLIVLLTSFVANVMYNKKYFLYKDDGLRAIRALKELMIYIGLIVYVLPMKYILDGLMQLVSTRMRVDDAIKQMGK